MATIEIFCSQTMCKKNFNYSWNIKPISISTPRQKIKPFLIGLIYRSPMKRAIAFHVTQALLIEKSITTRHSLYSGVPHFTYKSYHLIHLVFYLLFKRNVVVRETKVRFDNKKFHRSSIS